MTQQYTPVTWQDETTSQQGTLINAERLNQMQTAHHYADGFEEVDAVPAADPGVAYHKVVYCTADSTFYRWDGTEWTKDIDDETKALLQQEIARATEAEGELAQDIADEATARETADTAMQADITALQSGKLDKKTTGPLQYQIYGVRGSNQIMFDTWGTGHTKVPMYGIEDELLAKMPTISLTENTVVNYGWATAQIGAEATARTEADTLLGNRITDETTAREGADTALGNRITAEETRATQAEQANAQAIANTYTKTETDTLLGAKADQAITYTKTETDTLLASKADTATVNTLDAQNVKLTGPQTVRGLKTFTERIINKASGGYWLENTAIDWTVTPETNSYQFINDVFDKNNVEMFKQVVSDITTYRGLDFVLAYYNTSNVRKESILRIDAERTSDVATLRYYNGAVWSEVATVATLDAYAPMIRTTGNQTKAGILTLIGPGQSAMELSNYPIWQMRETAVGFDETGITASGMNFYRKGTYSGRFAETTEADGSVTIDMMIKSNVSDPAREGRLQIYEKTDHTFGMRFWNGTAWNNIVS